MQRGFGGFRIDQPFLTWPRHSENTFPAHFWQHMLQIGVAQPTHVDRPDGGGGRDELHRHVVGGPAPVPPDGAVVARGGHIGDAAHGGAGPGGREEHLRRGADEGGVEGQGEVLPLRGRAGDVEPGTAAAVTVWAGPTGKDGANSHKCEKFDKFDKFDKFE